MRQERMATVSVLVGILLGAAAVARAAAEPPKYPDDRFLGEYRGGGVMALAGSPLVVEAKVWPVKDGYRAAILDPSGGRIELAGKVADGKLVLAGAAGDIQWRATAADGKLSAESTNGGKFDLKAYERTPSTLGEKPPAGAMVLLPFEEGKKTNLDAWQSMKGEPAAWEILDDGSVRVNGRGNVQTKQAFGSMRLHMEFWCPYMPTASGQGRGNSGVYLQSRYECQVLDSFGLAPKDNECGGIYSVSAPKEIASLPPGRWQTYDITFKAPKVQDGKIVEPAVMSVVHNGIQIHENVKIDHVTTAGVGGPVVSPAPLMLQDHGNPVRYRNIWLVELKDGAGSAGAESK